jgi:hypothetical protein
MSGGFMTHRINIAQNASLFGLFTLILTGNAHAYVDPGTGSMALQFIIGGLVAAVFMLKTYYYSIKNKIASLFGRSTNIPVDPVEQSGSDAASESK